LNPIGDRRNRIGHDLPSATAWPLIEHLLGGNLGLLIVRFAQHFFFSLAFLAEAEYTLTVVDPSIDRANLCTWMIGDV
jgi:hypothetical protein